MKIFREIFVLSEVGQIFLGKTKFLRKFVLGQKIYPIGQKFSEKIF